MTTLKIGVKYEMMLVGKVAELAVEAGQPTEYIIKRTSEDRVFVMWKDNLALYEYKHVKRLIKDGKWDISWYLLRDENKKWGRS